MRPQDIVVLLKIVILGKANWQFQDLSRALYISGAEVSESLNRSRVAGLVDHDRKRVNRLSLFEFLQFGLPYVFPQVPGALTRGVATAHGHPYFHKRIISNDVYVWPCLDGKDYGQALEPLYPNQIKAVKEDAVLYEVLAMLDVLRIGRNREKRMAIEYLSKLLIDESPGEYSAYTGSV